MTMSRSLAVAAVKSDDDVMSPTRRSFLSALPGLAAASTIPAAAVLRPNVAHASPRPSLGEIEPIDPVSEAKERAAYHLREYMAAATVAWDVSDWDFTDPDDQEWRYIFVSGRIRGRS